MDPRSIPMSDPDGYRRWIYEETKRMIHSSQIGADAEYVLATLVKNAETYEDIAVTLWTYEGFVFKLLLQIIPVYGMLSTPYLTMRRANHLNNALTLLRLIAAHPNTRRLFITAAIPKYIYVFLEMKQTDQPHEIIRTSALCAISGLAEGQGKEGIKFLLGTLSYHHVFQSMRIGSVDSRLAGMYLFLRILDTDEGLHHIAMSLWQFVQLLDVLSFLVDTIVVDRSIELLANLVNCYVMLSRHPGLRGRLRNSLPSKLFDNTFKDLLTVYPPIVNGLHVLIQNLWTF